MKNNINRVLFVHSALFNSDYSYAGLEKMFVWVANALGDNGVDVTICTFYDTVRNPRFSSKVKVIYFGNSYDKRFFRRTITLFTNIRRKLKTVLNNYDAVVNFGDISFFVLLSLRPFCDFRFVVSERGDPYNKGSWLSKQKLKMFRFVDFIVFQTYGAQAFFSDKVKQKSIVIPNAVTIPKEQWIAIHTKHIISVGRIDFWQKRLDLLIDAFAIVLNKYPDYILDIYGDGEMERLKILCESKNVLDNVVLHGVTKDVNEKLMVSDLFVITSDFEGIPNALLEAMALGMPVVSTDCSPGGAAMLIDNGNNGLLVERGNAQLIADAILFLIEHPQKAIEFATNARINMRQYAPNIILNQWRESICPK